MSTFSPRARTVLALSLMLAVAVAMVVLGDLRPAPAAFVALAFALPPTRGPWPTTRRC
jgi:hypothetical protein